MVDKDTKINIGGKIASSTNTAEKTMSACKTLKLDSYL